MLSSKKGNLLCFQWEIERFQRIHREKIANATAQTKVKRASPRSRRDRLHKSAKDKQLEADIKLHNAFLLEKMAHVHQLGGCQQRAQHEFQNIKAPLPFGRANKNVARAVHEGRFTARRKEHERVRRANATMIIRLASPIRSEIDFNKFEIDYVKSRVHLRMAQCNHTIGHTSILEAVSTRTPHSEADVSYSGKPQCQIPKEALTGDARPPGRPTKMQGHKGRPGFSRQLKSRQRPFSAGFVQRRPHDDTGKNRSTGHIIKAWINQSLYDKAPSDSVEDQISMPSGPERGTKLHRHLPAHRPHTALGLRRDKDHNDFFYTRAADPGWGGNNSIKIPRPPSAPERVERGNWRKHDPECSRGLARRYAAVESYGMDYERERFAGGSKVEQDLHDISTGILNQGGDLWYLGRTLLAETKVIVNGSSKRKNQDRREVILRCRSLDGLVRQQGQVRKTLRGFVVEASLKPCRKSSWPCIVEGQDMKCAMGSASVSVLDVQQFLRAAAIEGSPALFTFRNARELDDHGNYAELRSVLGKNGQRDLCQVLFESSQLVVRKGRVSLKLLQTSADGGLKLSVTLGYPDEVSRCVPSHCQPNSTATEEQCIPGKTGTDDAAMAGGRPEDVAITTSTRGLEAHAGVPHQYYGANAASSGGAGERSVAFDAVRNNPNLCLTGSIRTLEAERKTIDGAAESGDDFVEEVTEE